uniref:Uncharacterized protein n=1 Tax=Panagrolaimus sp. ES5 TaxID=591445 RepID=A0AC34G0H9_9BILA
MCVRYLFAFPSSTVIGWFNFKTMIAISSVFTLGFGILITYAIINKSDPDKIHVEAIAYDEFFSTFTDPSLLYFSYGFGRPIGITWFAILNCLLIFSLALMAYFIHIVHSTKTKTVTQIQYYLIKNSMAEILLLCIFLILPATIFIGFVVFQIPNSAGFTVICISFIHLYSPINFIANLYFTAPYRRFLTKFLSEIIGVTKIQMKPINITPAETSVRRNN